MLKGNGKNGKKKNGVSLQGACIYTGPPDRGCHQGHSQSNCLLHHIHILPVQVLEPQVPPPVHLVPTLGLAALCGDLQNLYSHAVIGYGIMINIIYKCQLIL